MIRVLGRSSGQNTFFKNELFITTQPLDKETVGIATIFKPKRNKDLQTILKIHHQNMYELKTKVSDLIR